METGEEEMISAYINIDTKETNITIVCVEGHEAVG